MKLLVVYSSKGGNTKKLAETIFSRLANDKELVKINEAPDPGAYDAVAVGFRFQSGQPDPDSQEYLKKCKKHPKLFLFATHGSADDSEMAKIGMNKAREIAKGANIIGTFNCQGEVPAKVLETAANKSPQPSWLKDVESAKGRPNDDDLYALIQAIEKAKLATVPEPSEKRMFS